MLLEYVCVRAVNTTQGHMLDVYNTTLTRVAELKHIPDSGGGSVDGGSARGGGGGGGGGGLYATARGPRGAPSPPWEPPSALLLPSVTFSDRVIDGRLAGTVAGSAGTVLRLVAPSREPDHHAYAPTTLLPLHAAVANSVSRTVVHILKLSLPLLLGLYE